MVRWCGRLVGSRNLIVGRARDWLTSVAMARQERSAGFVVFIEDDIARSAGHEREFLLLDYGRHWDYPKGHVEPGEDDLTAARRELFEETGIQSFETVPGFGREVEYYFKSNRHGIVHKTVAFFLARIDSRSVRLSSEHVGHAFLPFSQACERLTFQTARSLLVDVRSFLRQGRH